MRMYVPSRVLIQSVLKAKESVRRMLVALRLSQF
jgi:hypothetical protein